MTNCLSDTLYYAYTSEILTIEQFKKIALEGGCIFPDPPKEFDPIENSFLVRLGESEAWVDFDERDGVLTLVDITSYNSNAKPIVDLIEKYSDVRLTDDPEMLEWDEE